MRSPTVLMPSRFKQLYERTDRLRSSMTMARSPVCPPSVAGGLGTIPWLSARSANSSTRPASVAPAEATAFRGLIDPSVSTSRISRSRSVICSTRVASTAYVTRRTGEKIESTGITPMGSRGFLLRSAET